MHKRCNPPYLMYSRAMSMDGGLMPPDSRGGYAGYFQDPDDHLWEVVWNPDLLPED